jgi:hypothetical protein
MLTGFTPPFTPTGRSSLVPPPPWHYAGDVVSMKFLVDQRAAQALLPDGFGQATGTAYGHFCEWQATTDGSELIDPVYAQYKEFFVLVEAAWRGGTERALFCPFIWVDQDISMVRGLLQGWPKKHGQVWITRSYDLDHPAAAPRRTGQRIGASLAVKDRRLAEADLTLTGEPGEKLGFFGTPTYGLVSTPTIVDGVSAGTQRVVRATISRSVAGSSHKATGRLRFFEHPREELAMLTPVGEVEASIGLFALTITGASEVQP